MSDLAWRVLDSLSRRGEQRPAPRGSPHPGGDRPAPISVEVRVPSARAEGAADLGAVLTDLMGGLARDLVVARDVEVTTSEHGGVAVLASVDDRPVAHVDISRIGEEEFSSFVGRRVMDGVMRRLPLLSGAAPVNRHATAYLAGLGCGPSSLAGDGVEAAERALDDRVDERIEVRVSTATLRRADRDARDAVIRFRTAEQRDYGIVYPDLEVFPVDEPAGTIRLRLNDVWLPPYRLDDEAGWVDVVEVVAREVRSHRHWFLRTRDVSDLLANDLVVLLPDLVEVTRLNFSPQLLTACLRELLRNDKRIRNLPRILWMLLEQGDRPPGPDMVRLAESPLLPRTSRGEWSKADPVLLAARVRKIHNEESWRLGNDVVPTNAFRLTPEVEDALTGSDDDSPGVPEAEWSAVRAVAGVPDLRRVVTRTIEAIAPVREALQAIEHPPRVTASQELPPDADMTLFPILTDPPMER